MRRVLLFFFLRFRLVCGKQQRGELFSLLIDESAWLNRFFFGKCSTRFESFYVVVVVVEVVFVFSMCTRLKKKTPHFV